MVLIINNRLENDYELLYLIENDSEEALEVMFEKYNNLIASLISKYHFNKEIEDDWENCTNFEERIIKRDDTMNINMIKYYPDYAV